MNALTRWTFNVQPGDNATYTLGSDSELGRAVMGEPFLAVDIETGKADTPNRWNIKCVSVSTPSMSWVLDPRVEPGRIKDVLKYGKALVFHNAPYDVPILHQAGLMDIASIDKVHDTILLSRLVDQSEKGKHDLGQCADRYIAPGYAQRKKGMETQMKRILRVKTLGDVFEVLDVDSDAFVMYAAMDTLMTARLFELLPGLMEKHHHDHPFNITQYASAQDVIDRETTVMRVMLRRSAKGLQMTDPANVDGIRAALLNEVAMANIDLAGQGVDITQSDDAVRKQVMQMLDARGYIGPRWKRLKDGSPSGDKKYLQGLNNDLGNMLLRRNEHSRYESTYLNQHFTGYRGRVFPSVNVMAAMTGRMSYTGPPLQQMPGVVRPMIVHEKPMTSIDWSSIEPVILLNMSGEIDLIRNFEEGGDLYQPVVELAGVTRKEAKTVTLGLNYGMGPDKLAGSLGITRDEAVVLRDKVKAAMPNAIKVIRNLSDVCDHHGRVVTMYGRVVSMEDDRDYETGNKKFKGYKGVNYYIQGTGLDLLSDAIVNLEKAGAGDGIVLAMHDELVVEDDIADLAQEVMTTPPEWMTDFLERTPVLRVGRSHLGMTWQDKE